MSKTLIDVDDDALAVAARILGTTTKRDTINSALRRVAGREGRAAAIKRMQELVAQEGVQDLTVLELPEEYGPKPGTP
ncbi:type II toxin-antitoxin system VapB family antitoxin [Embleya sp. NPDC020630]|uniref:type II toxin-antitoxin system VapB family antitoxin n=1 Tax=Embleya sp. NPDC020630 TaxID=3363979 RepID=UPI0037971336